MARGLAEAAPPGGRWNDLRARVLSALVLVPLTLVCVWFGGAAFALLIAAMGLGLAAECIAVMAGEGRPSTTSLAGEKARRGWPAFAGHDGRGHDGRGRDGGGRDGGGRDGRGHDGAGHDVGAGPYRGRPTRAVGIAAGFLYIGLAAAALLWLRADPVVGRTSLLVLLLLVWASDVGAYGVGRAVGGPRLAPAISPGKTISGAVGGLAAAVAVGLGAALALSHPVHLARTGLLAAGLGIVAQAGDLLESWVKRRLGVKDSGRLIPGHGGLFDRLDALLAAAPAAALLALWAGRGVAWWE